MHPAFKKKSAIRAFFLRLFVLLGVTLTILLIFFRKQFLLVVLHLACNSGTYLSYDLPDTKQNGLVLENILITKEGLQVRVSKAWIDLSINWKRFSLQPKLLIEKMAIESDLQMSAKLGSPGSGLLRFLAPRMVCSVKEGTLRIGDGEKQRLFSFGLVLNAIESQHLELKIRSEEEGSSLNITAKAIEKTYVIEAQSSQIQLEELFAFASLFKKLPSFESLKGDFQGDCLLSLSKGYQPLTFQLNGKCLGFRMQNEMDYSASSLKTQVAWPSSNLSVEIEDGTIGDQKTTIISDLNGSFFWSEETDSKLFMKGSLSSEQAPYPFLLEASGKIELDGLICVNGALILSKELLPISISYIRTKTGDEDIQLGASAMPLAPFERALSKVSPVIFVKKGLLSGTVQVKRYRKQIQELTFVECSLDDFKMCAQDYVLSGDRINAFGSLGFTNEPDLLDYDQFYLEMLGIDLMKEERTFVKDFSLTAEGDYTGKMTLSGAAQLLDEPMHLNIKRTEDYVIHIDAKMGMAPINYAMGIKTLFTPAPSKAVHLIARLSEDGENKCLIGNLGFLNEGKNSSIEISLKHPQKGGFKTQKLFGECKSPSLDLEMLMPLLISINEKLQIKGECSFQGKIKEGICHIEAKPYFLTLRSPQFSFEETRQKGKAPWVFDIPLTGEGTLHGKGQIESAKIVASNSSASIGGIRMSFELFPSKLLLNEIQVQDPSATFRGKAQITAHETKVFLDQYKLNVPAILPFVQEFYVMAPFLQSTKGEIISKDAQTKAIFNTTGTTFSTQGQLLLTELAFSSDYGLHNACMLFEIQEDRLKLYAGKADLWDNEKSLLGCQLKKMILDKEGLELQISAFQGKEEFLSLDINHSKSQIRIFGKESLLEDFVPYKSCKLKGSHNIQDFKSLIASLPPKIRAPLLIQKEAILDWNLNYDEGRIHLNGQLKDLLIFSKTQKSIDLDATYYKSQISLKLTDETRVLDINCHKELSSFELDRIYCSFPFGDFLGTGSYQIAPQCWNLEIEELNLESTHPMLMGSYQLKGNLTGDLVNPWKGVLGLKGSLKSFDKTRILSKNGIGFTYSDGKLFIEPCKLYYQLLGSFENVLSISDLQIEKDFIHIGKLNHDFSQQELGLLAKGKFLPSFLPALIMSSWKGQLSAKYEQGHWTLHGTAPSLDTKLISKGLLLQSVRYEINDQNVCVGAEFQMEKAPIFAQMRFDFTKGTPGLLVLQGKKGEGLKLYFSGFHKDLPLFHNIQGSLYGAEINVVKKGSFFEGNASLNLSEFTPLLTASMRDSLEKLGFCDTLHLAGKFKLFDKESYFSGDISSSHFRIFGCFLDHFKAHAEYDGSMINLSDARLEDPAFLGVIKRAVLRQEDGWQLSCPYAQLTNFRPSLLRKSQEETPSVKPLTLKKVSLFNVSGDISKLDSLKGTGELFFTNFARKDADLFDLPRNFIKDLGLDPSILTPSSGEISFDILDKKLRLSSIRNVSSEERRSEFTLLNEEESYIDFDGNIHVNMAVKQNVMLKIVEPFTLSIRGSLKKPRYILK